MEYIQCAIDGFEKDKKTKSVKSDLKFAVKSVTEIKNVNTDSVSKAGIYITYDLKKALADCRADFIKSFGMDILSLAKSCIKLETVLVVGLGNSSFECDRLGSIVASKITVTRGREYVVQNVLESKRLRRHNNDKNKIAVCRALPEVLSKTGINSSEFVEGICDKIKPDLVIVCDTLCTLSVGRINNSFQLSDAGIKPGGGVGVETGDISKESLNIPVIAIGVPLVLKTSGLIFDFLSAYESKAGRRVDMERYGQMVLSQSAKYVTPKDIDFVVEQTAEVIAKAIDFAFGNCQE